MCRWIGSRGRSPSTRTRSSRRQSGFTLLEVLIAFAVLAVMMVPILQVFGGGLGTAETARAYSTGVLLARSKLAEAGLTEPLLEGETTGSFDVPGYHWRQSVIRDDSEVIDTAPDGDDRSNARRSHRSDRQRRESRTFSNERSDSYGTSRFSERRGSFGRQSRFGEGQSDGRRGFGDQREGMADSRGQLGRSRRSSSSTGGPVGGEAEVGEQTDEIITYKVTVTVEWKGDRGDGGLTLSTLRVGREPNGLGAGVR